MRLIRSVLLSDEQALEAYTTGDDLGGYIVEVEKAVDAFFTYLEPRIDRDLALQLELNPKGHSVRFVAAPGLDIKAGGKLRESLESVRAPTVGGPVKLDLILKVWGIASEQ